MKKLTFLLAAGNLFLMLSCGKTEKQPGEEYYDPDYKPQTTQPVAQAGNDDNTTSAAPVAGNASDSGSTEAATTTPGPQVTTAQPSGTKVEGAPADKDEVEVAVVPKDKLQASPAGKSFDKGKTLISKSDCLACHQDNAKLVGPAYVDVANKYENNAKNVDHLVTKIIQGGAGAWGQIPMSPHPNLSKNDATEMVNYILSLKK